MKKQSGMVSVISLILALSACGGGGEGSSATNHPIASNSNILFDNKDTFYSYKLGIDEAATEKNTFTRRNDILYLKTNYPATAKQYGSYFLTETELYQPERPATVNPVQGIRDSFIKSVTDQELISSPYNPQGYKELEIKIKSNAVDLKGKLIAPILAPSDAAYVSFYQNNPEHSQLKLSLVSKILTANAVFPEGSKCLQTVSTEYNTSNLQFQPNDETQVIPNVRSLQEWANQAFSDGVTASTLVTKYHWAGYNWGAIQLKNYDAQDRIQYLTAIEYQGKVYYATFKTGKELFTDLLTSYRQYLLDQGTPAQLINAVISNLGNGCPTYNDIAAKAIDEAIKKAQNISVDLPISGHLPVSGGSTDIPNCNGSLSFC